MESNEELTLRPHWFHMASHCHRCGPDPEGMDSCPAAILVTAHRTDSGSRLSLAAQVCSHCVETEGLETWVAQTDPWDEASDALMIGCADEPLLISIQRIEPRCTRCRLLVVEHIALLEMGDGSFSVGPIAHLCNACFQGMEDAMSGHGPAGSDH